MATIRLNLCEIILVVSKDVATILKFLLKEWYQVSYPLYICIDLHHMDI